MKKKIIIGIVGLLVVVGSAFYMGFIPMGGDSAIAGEAEVVEYDSQGNPLPVVGEALYLPLDPAFVVNFVNQGVLGYLQVELEIMYHDNELLERVSNHMPAIRNGLILLLSDQEFEKLSSLSGKEQLRKEMMQTINELILTEEELAENLTGEVFITNYIMQ